jgi:hypothetical protein
MAAVLRHLGMDVAAWIEILELDLPNPETLGEWEVGLSAAAAASRTIDKALAGSNQQWGERSSG